MSTTTPPPSPLDDVAGDIDLDGIDEEEVEQVVSDGIQRVTESRDRGKSHPDPDSKKYELVASATKKSVGTTVIRQADVGNSRARDSMNPHAQQADLSNLRTFIGWSSIACLIFLALFVSLFLGGDVSAPVIAVVVLVLTITAAGFAKLWYDLRPA